MLPLLRLRSKKMFESVAVFTALLLAIPLLVVIGGTVLAGVTIQKHRKQLYSANRARLSSELITLDEHIGFAEADADPKRQKNVVQARLALDAAFQSHAQHFNADNPKGVAIRNATFEVDNHLETARRYLAAPAATSNEEIVAAAKELGRSVAALAKVGTAKLIATSTQEINRFHQDLTASTMAPRWTGVFEDSPNE